MANHQHLAATRGRIFLWGGIGLGWAFLLGLLTQGFGPLAARHNATAEAPTVVHQGDKIIVPDGSPLRERLQVMAAPSELVSPKLVLPAVVEADPARTAAVLSPLSGRVLELTVALGDRVGRGQLLALIDSPDLAQAYDDYQKAADSFELTRKKLEFFKNEGLAPDAQKRIATFFKAGQQKS
jgi:membrane fusion protein, heavy metal efflux system